MKRDNTQMKGKQEGNRRQIIDCPFCEGDIGGCCFCEHTGKVPVGEGEFIKTEEQTKSIGVQFLKEHNPGEIWPEMWEYFLKDENVPKWYNQTTIHNARSSETKI